MSPAWGARVFLAQDKGLPIALIWNQGSYINSYYYIMTGAPHLEEAYKFKDFLCKAMPQAAVAMEIPYGPSNKKALDLIPDAQRKRLSTYPENLKVMFPLDGEWLGKHYDEINDRWQKFMIM